MKKILCFLENSLARAMYPFSMAMAYGQPLSRDIFTAEALSFTPKLL